MSKAAELANLIGNINAGGGGANKNVIINGNMSCSQRGTTSTGLGANATSYNTVDRFQFTTSGTDGRFTMTQDSSAPSGFANSLKLDCTTADTSIAAGEIFLLSTLLEGQDVQRFAKGTSDAKPFALSFYVKGNASATYVAELYDNDNNRQVSKTFNVTTDWTRVELSMGADTTGAFDDDNAVSLTFQIWLHGGSTFTGGTLNTTWGSVKQANRAAGISSFFDSTDRTFFLTGVQLEVGQNPTEFEHEPFERTLEKCLRYYEIIKPLGISNGVFGFGGYYSSSLVFLDLVYKQKRSTSPAFEQTTITNGYLIETNSASDYWNSFTGMLRQTDTRSQIYTQSDVGGTAGMAGVCWTNSTNTFLAVEDEL